MHYEYGRRCGGAAAQPENCALYTKVPDMDDPAPEDEDDEAFEEAKIEAAPDFEAGQEDME